MQAVSKGVWLCIFSQSLFGIMYLFSAWMLPLNGTDVFVLRMIGSLFAILAILLPIMGLSGLKTFIRNELGASWKRWLTFLMGSALAGSQFWLFMWAPVNGEGVNVAVGYFLFPLVMAFGGYLWFKERLTLLQKMALFLAALGVAHENTGVARLNVRYYFYFDSLLYLLSISTKCNRFIGQRFALLVVRAIIGIN